MPNQTKQVRKRAPYRKDKKGLTSVVPDPVDWSDPEVVRAAKWLCLQRTPEGLSFLARHVLGQNWWRIQHHFNYTVDHLAIYEGGRFGNWHTCGLVDWGEHRRMAKALAKRKNPVLFCSRNANKTWWGCVLVVQTILESRDVRWLVNMATKELAQKTLRLIKQFLECPKLVELFGEFKGDQWTEDMMTVCGRTRFDRCATITATGAWAMNVGDRCDNLWVDDPVDFRMARNPERLKAAIDMVQNLQPLRDPGGFQFDTLTPYELNDYAAYLLGENSRSKRQGSSKRDVVHAPCGMIASYDRKGAAVLTGDPLFPRLNKNFLRQQLAEMGVDRFNRQYGLMISNPEAEIFHREDLIPADWENRFQRMCSYILTDTSTADHEDACQAVLALVTIDFDSTAYVLDVRIGKWKPSQFRDNFIQFIKDWRADTMIVGIAMERVTLNHTYMAWLSEDMRKNGISIPWIELPRGDQVDAPKQGDTKRKRIRALEPRVRARKLRFVESVMTRMAWIDGKQVAIYRGEGFASVDGKSLPSGEIVDQFISWRDIKSYKGMMDILDCFSALDQVDNNGRRLLSPSPVTRSTEFGAPMPGSTRQSVRRATPQRKSFWDRTIKRAR